MRTRYVENPVCIVSRLVVTLTDVLTMLAFAITPVLAQHSAGSMEGVTKSMSFDAVSIRPANPNSQELAEAGVDGNTFYLRDLPLTGVITTAFFDRGRTPQGFVDSLPKWIREERFNITAKMSASDYEALQRVTHESHPNIPMNMLHQMLQNMLKERCNLAVHHTQTVLHGYSLEVGKRGINPKKMKVSTASEIVPGNAISGGGAWLTTITPPEDGQNARRTFYRMTMSEFVSHVSSGTVVHDNTGLTARYNFSVELVDGAHDISERFDVSPLGLKWKRMDTVTDAVVIDHIDRPSPN